MQDVKPCHFNVQQVNNAIRKLKSQKGDGDKGLISDMVIKSSTQWRTLFAEMVTEMFNHGYYPQVLGKSTICSLPKDPTGNICNGDNFRGIALSSPLNKVIDWIILCQYKDEFCTSDL